MAKKRHMLAKKRQMSSIKILLTAAEAEEIEQIIKAKGEKHTISEYIQQAISSGISRDRENYLSS